MWFGVSDGLSLLINLHIISSQRSYIDALAGLICPRMYVPGSTSRRLQDTHRCLVESMVANRIVGASQPGTQGLEVLDYGPVAPPADER